MVNFSAIMSVNSSVFNITSSQLSLTIFFFFRYLIALLYFIIFLLGVSGNLAAIYIMMCKLKRSATSMFLINLSVADLMMALFCVPLTFISDCLLLHWVFGSVMCKFFPFIQGVSVFLSALTHVAISVDRYLVVFHSLRRQSCPMRGVLFIVCFVWIFSVFVSVPMLFVSVIVEKDHIQFCREMWLDDNHAVIYSLVVLVLQYFLPLVVIVISYSAIAVKIWSHRPPGESIRSRDEALVISKRKMIKMFIMVAVFYSSSQLPRHVIYMVSLYFESEVFWDESTIWLMNFTHLLSMSACIYNPLLYVWLNAAFRKRFQQLFDFKRVCSAHSNPDRDCTFQDNVLQTRRLRTLSCNAMFSPKLALRRL